MKYRLITIIAAIGIGSVAVTASTTGVSAADVSPGQIATFEGRTFDMSRGWGQATACTITDTGASCYRSETEMDKAIAADPPASRAVNCSTSLRLYDGTGQTGAVISLSTRGTSVSLSAYGFDNRTSSYRVGACSSTFYSGVSTGVYGGTQQRTRQHRRCCRVGTTLFPRSSSAEPRNDRRSVGHM